MKIRELTLAKINQLEAISDKTWALVRNWEITIFRSDGVNKKRDLSQVNLFKQQHDLSTEALNLVLQELAMRQKIIDQKDQHIRKLERYVKALGGDPELMGWHRSHDF